MAAPSKIPVRVLLIMAIVPIFWLALDRMGALGKLKNMSMDWMFYIRGQMPAYDSTKPGNPPLKITYVDIDAPTIQKFGERPWRRDVYANLINDVIELGHAKAVGLDFFLSPAGMKSYLVDQKLAHDGNEAMASVMKKYPQAIIAAEYSNILHKNFLDPTSTEERQSKFPYIYQGFTDPKTNAYPESPSYPLIGLNYGTVALIDVATTYGGTGTVDSVPRWIPLFAETEGPDHALNLIWGILDQLGLKNDDVLRTEDAFVIVDPKTLDAMTIPAIHKKMFYNLSLELTLAYLGLDRSNLHRSDTAIELVDKDGKTLLDIPLTEKQLVEINWFSKWDNAEFNPRIGSLDVLANANFIRNGTPEEKAVAGKLFEKLFDGAIVLIGPTDETLQDVAPTPFDGRNVPKVSVYGNLLKTFFTGEYIKRVPSWMDILIQFLLTGIVSGLAIYSGHHAGWAKFGGVLVLVGYVAAVFLVFAHFTLVLPLMVPVISAFTTAFVGAVVRLVDEEKQRKRIKGMFGTYLAPEVVNEMVESGKEPELGGHNVVITCFFSDVQGFSTFSEVMKPDQLTNLMNEFLTAMTDILQSERGSLDKYIGDAIVAMYGAPIDLTDHALRACVSACRMQKRLGELRQKWIGEGGKWPERVYKMRMRIGLNTGETIVGNMGSASRFNFTMMGDTVNLAARLESGAKKFGVYTMCSEDTKNSAEQNGRQVLFRRLNKIVVKGKTQPVEIYEVVCFREEATPETLKCIELFEKALELYMAQKWDEAKALFAEAQKLEPLQPGRDPGVAHNPSELMQEWCDEKKANPPPADWDGVETMTEK